MVGVTRTSEGGRVEYRLALVASSGSLCVCGRAAIACVGWEMRMRAWVGGASCLPWVVVAQFHFFTWGGDQRRVFCSGGVCARFAYHMSPFAALYSFLSPSCTLSCGLPPSWVFVFVLSQPVVRPVSRWWSCSYTNCVFVIFLKNVFCILYSGCLIS